MVTFRTRKMRMTSYGRSFLWSHERGVFFHVAATGVHGHGGLVEAAHIQIVLAGAFVKCATIPDPAVGGDGCRWMYEYLSAPTT